MKLTMTSVARNVQFQGVILQWYKRLCIHPVTILIQCTIKIIFVFVNTKNSTQLKMLRSTYK